MLAIILLLLSSFALAADFKLSGEQRQQIIRAFLAERAYAHRALPLGKAGLIIEGGTISPPDREVLDGGTAAKPGERVEITGVRFEREGIRFEINGGAVKHERWSDRIHIGMGGPELSSSRPADANVPGGGVPAQRDAHDSGEAEPKGAAILLKLDNSAGITAERVRTLLAPVLDFGSTSQAEAYQKNLSPVLAAALRDHRALVGMDRDMVMAAVGRPARRLRESADGQAYEEWIYGTPPQEIQFIRFVGRKVVRIEQMKVTGEKLVRTEDEVGKIDGVLDASAPPIPISQPRADGGPAAAGAAPAMASPGGNIPSVSSSDATPNANSDASRSKPPTLQRPGEARPPSN